MHDPYELLSGRRSHGVFPTCKAAKDFAVLRDRIVGVEIYWDDELQAERQGAIGRRSNGAQAWQVRPVPAAAPVG